MLLHCRPNCSAGLGFAALGAVGTQGAWVCSCGRQGAPWAAVLGGHRDRRGDHGPAAQGRGSGSAAAEQALPARGHAAGSLSWLSA